MRKKMIAKWLVLALLCLAFLSSATAQYGYREDKGGFSFRVEGWWVTPTGMGFDVATLNEDWVIDANARGGGDVLDVTFESKFSERATMGWDFGEDLGSLMVSYWNYDEGSSLSRSGDPRSYIIGELLVHPYYSGQGFYDPDFFYDTGRADAVDSMASIETTLIDLDFSRNFSFDQKFSGSWRIGLRSFKYEHSFETDYLGDPMVADAKVLLDVVSETISSDGVGPRVGISGGYSFSNYFSMYGGLDVSFIPGKIDSTYISHNDLEAWDPEAGDEWGPFLFRLSREDRDENFLIYDFDAGFKLAIAQKLNLFIGYRFTKMENVIYRMRFAPDKDWYSGAGVDLYANWDAATNNQPDLNFAGLYFGIGYKF
ncbi:MAG: Lpg1974 family pore-forming outer membrane protein [Acidobacteriota bacterium]